MNSARIIKRPRVHSHHDIHENSREAYHQVDHTGRQAEVISALRSLKIASDRTVLHYLMERDDKIREDMNHVRPAITQLKQMGVIQEVGHEEDPITQRNVRLVALTDWTKQQQEQQNQKPAETIFDLPGVNK